MIYSENEKEQCVSGTIIRSKNKKGYILTEYMGTENTIAGIIPKGTPYHYAPWGYLIKCFVIPNK